jgi:hypothetical protein
MINEHKKGVKAIKYNAKPRNFVAKNAGATTSGAGAHKDKKKAMKQGEVKHKAKELAESIPYDQKLNFLLKAAVIKDKIRESVTTEGAKVDRQARHITASMMKKGKSRDEAEAIAWAHIKHPKKKKVKEENAEYDDEAGMARSSLKTMHRAIIGLAKTINNGDNLPEWCQEKLSLAEDYLVTVWDYLQSKQGVSEGWKDESSEHDEFLAHARQQLQNVTPVERVRLAQRLSKLEQKHFPEMSSIEGNGISSSITGMLHSITDAKPRPNQQFGNVTTPQGSGSAEPLRPAPIQNKPSGATTSFAEPDNDEFDNQGSNSFNDFVDWYQSASDGEQAELQQDIANTENMSPDEAKEYIDYIIKNGKIEPRKWKEMKATELKEKITAVSGAAPAGYNNKPTTSSSKKPVGPGVTGGTVYTGGSSQRPAKPAGTLDRVRSKMGKGVAEDAHGSEHFMDIVDATNGDVRGIMQELRSSGLHSEIIKFCQWAREQGIADIYDAMKLAKRVGLENDDENEFAYEGYLHIKELLGGVAEAGYGRNRGYTQGFASPNAPSLGGNRYDSDGNQLGGGHDEYPSGGNQPMNFDRPQIVAWWFFDVPPDREEEARAYDIKKTKSGKYGMPQYDKSGRSFALRMNTATQKFGKPKKWVPKQ